MRVAVVIVLVSLVSPSSSWAFECATEGFAQLRLVPHRKLSSLGPESGKPRAQFDLRNQLPEMGRLPTPHEALSAAEKLLTASARDPIAQWRAAEILDALERSEISLSPQHRTLVREYRNQRSELLNTGFDLDIGDLSKPQLAQFLKVSALFGESAKMDGSNIHLSLSVSSDPIAAGRLAFMLSEWNNADRSFDQKLNKLIDTGMDLISSRATARQIALAPEIYARWPQHRLIGQISHRSDAARNYRDPYGRISVIDIREREFDRGTLPRRIEVIQLVSLAGNDTDSSDVGLRFAHKKTNGDPANAASCVTCHRTRGSELFTLVSNSRLETQDFANSAQVVPAIPGRASFVSSDFLRSRFTEPLPESPH